MRALLIGTTILTSLHAHADVLNVPSEYPTIQLALNAASEGDEILIAPGVYKEELYTNTSGITLTGSGIDTTIISGDIDGTGSKSALGPEFNISFGDVLVQSMTISGFKSAFYATGPGTVEIRDCSFVDNNEGPRLTLSEGNSLIQRCTFSQINQAALDLGDFGLASHTIIDCDFQGNNAGVDGNNIIIESSTFSNHNSIAVAGEDITIRDCNFTGNNNAVTASGEVWVESCEFTDNVQSNPFHAGGAAISQDAGNCTIVNSTFTRNTTEQNWGGAVDFNGLSLTVTGCAFTENKCGSEHKNNPFPYSHGGAIHADASGIDIVNTTFEGNVSNATGAAVCLSTFGEDARIVNCEFIRNGRTVGPGGQANQLIGGAFCNETGRTLIENCEFRENAANQGGAIASGRLGQVNIRGCRFYANTATTGQGGAIAVDREDLIVSCIFVGNSARFCGAIGWNPEYTNPSPDVHNSVFVDNRASALGNVLYFEESELLPLHNSIVVTRSRTNNFLSTDFRTNQLYYPMPASNALFIRNNTARFNRMPNDGGDGWGDNPATPTIDESANDDFGDLQLSPNSPCIDAGDNALIPADSEDFDADGNIGEPITGTADLANLPRFVDIPDVANAYPGNSFGGPIDLGPFEFQEVPCLADVNGDGMVTPTDFTAWVGAFNSNAPECDQNGDGMCTPTDFSAWVGNYNAGC